MTPNQFVFMDECCSDRRDHIRRRGRAPAGLRVPPKGAFRVRGNRIASIVAMSQEGILAEISYEGDTIDGDTMADAVEDSVIPMMNPFPSKHSVLILDNASVHKTDQLAAIAEAAGIRLVFLPPYCPFLNPTEHIFSQVKSFLRRFGPSFRRAAFGTDYDLLCYAFNHVTSQDCRSYFVSCGFI